VHNTSLDDVHQELFAGVEINAELVDALSTFNDGNYVERWSG
jgi:hypothetical protein